MPMSTIAVTVDGVPYRGPEHMQYKAMMLTGVPNFLFCMGYTNASWTLKSTLTARFLCRLVNRMFEPGREAALALVRRDPGVAVDPDWLALSSGYVQRAEGTTPLQGDRAPFKLKQNYLYDSVQLGWGALEDGHLRFEGVVANAAAPGAAAAAAAPQARL